MRHHGAPTRLLDWTYSFFVAVQFAIKLAKPNDKCAIWVIDIDWLDKRACDSLPKELKEKWEDLKESKDTSLINNIFSQNRKMVFPINPFRLNERLIIQQGIFLAPGDITISFMENLKSGVSVELLQSKIKKIEISISKGFLKDAYNTLKSMNITEATLFPGLDGFSRSLFQDAITFDPEIFSNANAFLDFLPAKGDG